MATGNARMSLTARSPLAPQKIYLENRMQQCTIKLNARYILREQDAEVSQSLWCSTLRGALSLRNGIREGLKPYDVASIRRILDR